VEAARVLGQTLVKESNGDVGRMIEMGMLRCLSRKPDAREKEILTRLWEEQKAHFAGRPEEAKKLMSIGRAPMEGDAVSVAAATVLAQALMNHDESVVKR
jgi:hypothetical protein